MLRSRFKYTLVDVGVTGTEVSNVTLDFCDTILMVVGMDLARLRAARLYMAHLLEANFPREKIQVVLNDIQPESKSISTAQAESILEATVAVRVPNEGRLVPRLNQLGPAICAYPPRFPCFPGDQRPGGETRRGCRQGIVLQGVVQATALG